jgi:hypothetical protein
MVARRLTWEIHLPGADHALVYVPPSPRGEPSLFSLDDEPLALAWKRAPTRASVRSGVRADIATFRIDGHRAALFRTIRPSGCSGWLSGVLMAVLALGGALIVDAINASRTVAEPLDVEFRLEVDGRFVPGELLPA